MYLCESEENSTAWEAIYTLVQLDVYEDVYDTLRASPTPYIPFTHFWKPYSNVWTVITIHVQENRFNRVLIDSRSARFQFFAH